MIAFIFLGSMTGIAIGLLLSLLVYVQHRNEWERRERNTYELKGTVRNKE